MSKRSVRVIPVLASVAALIGGACLGVPAALASGPGWSGGPSPVEGLANPSSILAGKGPLAPAVSGPLIGAGCVPGPSGAAYYAPAGPAGGKTVALTFDDGPGSTSTSKVISVLRQYGVPATFFNIGQNEANYPSLVRTEATLGFLVGNHTWNHPNLNTLSAAGQGSQIDEATAEQESLIGWGPCVFRPPYGNYGSATLSLTHQRAMRLWTWSVDTEDWKAAGSSSSYWVNRIISLAESEGGALSHPVILMHNAPSGDPATVAALPTIIKYFQARGYTFVNLEGSTGTGYQVLSAAGGVQGFGATGYGSAAGTLPSGAAAAGLATDPDSGGYWLLASNGAVSAFHAPALGSAAGKLPTGDTATAIAASRGGYLVLASDGGVFTFGAPFHGSPHGKLPSGVRAVGIAADVDTGGYWITASDGGMYSFDAPFYGAPRGTLHAGETATGIAASPQGGYLILTSEGRVGTFNGQYYGAITGKLPAGVTAVAIAIAPATGGYWILESNGTVTAFHAPARGSVKNPTGHQAVAITGD
jgi:peptidoglycan/xylan/chitin deacetylase (PgdA/CDA1 family)